MYLVVSICEDPAWDISDHNPEPHMLVETEEEACRWVDVYESAGGWHKGTRFEVWSILNYVVMDKNIINEKV